MPFRLRWNISAADKTASMRPVNSASVAAVAPVYTEGKDHFVVDQAALTETIENSPRFLEELENTFYEESLGFFMQGTRKWTPTLEEPEAQQPMAQ